jgi:hypothetical protein
MARVLDRDFDFDVRADPDWSELMRWAELIDGALFDGAEQVVALKSPALRLMAWLKHEQRDELRHRLIGELGCVPLAELVQRDYVQESLGDLLLARDRGVELARTHTHLDGRVAVCDLLEVDSPGHNNFVVYMLEPDSEYSVTLRRDKGQFQLSVGYNPWCGRKRVHHVASICERYGGGGHPAVGGIAVDDKGPAEARRIAAEVVATLNGSPA